MNKIRMSKKAQITIFILAGVLILGAAAFFILTQFVFVAEQNVIVPIKDQIQALVDNCIQEMAESSLYLIGLQGGYTEILAEPNIEKLNNRIAYAKKGGSRLFPSLENIKTQIKSQLIKTIPRCTDDFSALKDKGATITAKQLNADVEFAENEVIIKVYYPITAKDSKSTTDFEEFIQNIPVRFKMIHDTVSKIISNQQIDLAYLGTIDIDTTIYPYEDSIVYHLTDKNSKLYAKPYNFLSAVS